jgi:hypothetical protein
METMQSHFAQLQGIYQRPANSRNPISSAVVIWAISRLPSNAPFFINWGEPDDQGWVQAPHAIASLIREGGAHHREQ